MNRKIEFCLMDDVMNSMDEAICDQHMNWSLSLTDLRSLEFNIHQNCVNCQNRSAKHNRRTTHASVL